MSKFQLKGEAATYDPSIPHLSGTLVGYGFGFELWNELRTRLRGEKYLIDRD